MIASADLFHRLLLCWGTSSFTLRCLFSIGANVNTVEKYKNISVIVKIVLTLQTPERVSRGIQGPHFENLLVPVKLLMSQWKTVMDCVLIHHVFPSSVPASPSISSLEKHQGLLGPFLGFDLGWAGRPELSEAAFRILSDALSRKLKGPERVRIGRTSPGFCETYSLQIKHSPLVASSSLVSERTQNPFLNLEPSCRPNTC